jgi:hypothetical protein
MPEILAQEPRSETLTEQRSAEVIKTKEGWAAGFGLTADDVPAEITSEASLTACPDHPTAQSNPGGGYAGGGIGSYRICSECGTIFGKTEWKGVK